MKYGFGVDLGGTTGKIACFRENGDLLDKWEVPTDTAEGGSRILPQIAASIAACRKKLEGLPCMGIGIGVPGPVDSRGVVNGCVNLGWGKVDVSAKLAELTGLPVRAGNDASLAALGESWKGGGAGCGSMVLVTLGTGVGGGIIVNGNVLYGARGAGGEIGHITLNPQETQACSCGKRGCAEQYCSATGIVNLARQYLAAHQEPSCLRALPELTCKDVFDGGRRGDPAAAAILDQAYRYLGLLLADLCCVVDPEVLVLGGGVSNAGQMLLDGIQPYFDQYVFAPCRGTRLALASLGNDAGIYGAFRLLLQE